MNDRIQEIRDRLDSATNGNWEVTDLGDIHITTEHRVEGDKHVAHWIAEMYVDDCDDEQEVERAHNDAFFIANSKADIAYLLSEVERLQGLMELAKDTVESLYQLTQRGELSSFDPSPP